MLFLYPDELVSTIAVQWITLPEVAHLDSALCCRRLRPAALAVLYHRRNVFRTDELIRSLGRRFEKTFTLWMLARDVSVSCLLVNEVLNELTDQCVKFLECHGELVSKVVFASLYDTSTILFARFKFSTIAAVCCSCPNTLAVHCDNILDKMDFAIIADNWPRLREISITSATFFSDLVFVADRCHHLQAMDLTSVYTHQSPEGTCIRTGEFLSQLAGEHVLSLNTGVNKGIEAEAYEVIATHFPRLRSLRMNGSYLSNSALARIAKGCPELESIYLKECEVRLSRGLKALAEDCPRLNDIHLSRTTSLGNTAMHTLITAKAKTLRKLRLFMADTIQPGVITAISTLCINLVHLDICDCDFAVHSDAFMCSISSTCRGLQSLNLSPCTDVTDVGVSAVAQHCKLLCSLRISGCPGLTSAGLDAVAIYSTSLQRLELSHCKSVSDAGIDAIAQHRGAVFKALILERLSGCTDSLLQTVVNSCPYLSYLRVYGCPNITPGGLAFLAVPGSRVREIRYWSNQSCSVGTMVDVLTVIAERCRYLRVLALDGRFLSPPSFPKHLFPGVRLNHWVHDVVEEEE